MRPRRRRLLIVAPLCVVLGVAGRATAQGMEPYRDPPFSCSVIDYGTQAPTLPGPAVDPLCVRYDKTNITLDDLGVIDFLSGEPGRVGLAVGRCGYWQQDSWVVRITSGTPALVSWNGSYWYDARSGTGAGILRDLRVGDQPASGDAFVDALAPLIGSDQAEELRRYADDGGGGGASFELPEGFSANGACGTGDAPTTTTAAPPPTEPARRAPEPESDERRTIPVTGGDHGLVAGAGLLVASLCVRALRPRP